MKAFDFNSSIISEPKIKNTVKKLENSESLNFKKIKGVVNPISWDSNNRPTLLSLYTPDGEDIIIANNGSLKKFTKYINKNVMVKGELNELDEDLRSIIVSRVHPVHEMVAA
ncbi:MAG: hypothetical protein HQK49_16775 [Oligoflexia bacterium]|nr:hypothetical protein [Oligoflexia bacterium]